MGDIRSGANNGSLQLDLWQATGQPAGQLQRLARGAGRVNGSNAAAQFGHSRRVRAQVQVQRVPSQP